MTNAYALIDNLSGLIDNIQPESITSRTFFRGDELKGILFGFDAGQELSEHTSSQAAVIQILSGEAVVTLGNDRHELSTGAWLYMTPNLKHSVFARTPLVMLLLMIQTG